MSEDQESDSESDEDDDLFKNTNREVVEISQEETSSESEED